MCWGFNNEYIYILTIKLLLVFEKGQNIHSLVTSQEKCYPQWLIPNAVWVTQDPFALPIFWDLTGTDTSYFCRSLVAYKGINAHHIGQDHPWYRMGLWKELIRLKYNQWTKRYISPRGWASVQDVDFIRIFFSMRQTRAGLGLSFLFLRYCTEPLPRG